MLERVNRVEDFQVSDGLHVESLYVVGHPEDGAGCHDTKFVAAVEDWCAFSVECSTSLSQ